MVKQGFPHSPSASTKGSNPNIHQSKSPMSEGLNPRKDAFRLFGGGPFPANGSKELGAPHLRAAKLHTQQRRPVSSEPPAAKGIKRCVCICLKIGGVPSAAPKKENANSVFLLLLVHTDPKIWLGRKSVSFQNQNASLELKGVYNSVLARVSFGFPLPGSLCADWVCDWSCSS